MNPNQAAANLLLQFVDAKGARRPSYMRLAPLASLPVSVAVTSPDGRVVEVLRAFESDIAVRVEGLPDRERRTGTTGHGR